MEPRIILIHLLIKLGVAAAVSSALVRSKEFKKLLFQEHRATRQKIYLALWMAIHLGVVMALFLTLPYGKFAHGIFRCAALLKWSIERRQPSRLRLSAD